MRIDGDSIYSVCRKISGVVCWLSGQKLGVVCALFSFCLFFFFKNGLSVLNYFLKNLMF